MKVYNTLTKKKEEFTPLEEGKVSMYVCGPTVYNLIHIGNARPMIVFDTVRRYLEYKGYEVNYVSNFTDVDDKIIKKSVEEGIPAEEVAKRYIAECKKDMAAMNVKPATTHPLATQEIPGMLDMISTLIAKGYAYAAEDGTVYYRTRNFKGYGKLSGKNIDDLQAGHRDIQVTGELKEDPLDFVLWKPKKEGEPYWESPWCKGRPGWHIECSVMAKKYLGDEIDIHAGGEDLIFPHHENEIAQSEAANGTPFARYWLHNAFLNIDNKKMSKSLGNFFTVRDIAEKYDLQVLRFFMLSAHYRSPLNFSAELMDAAKNGLERILTAAENLKRLSEASAAASQTGADSDGGGELHPGGTSAAQGQPGAQGEGKCTVISSPDGMTDEEQSLFVQTDACVKKFEASMEDDFNTADAVSAVFELVKFCNTHASADGSKAYLDALSERLTLLCDVLGIITEKEEEILDAEIEQLIEERKAARKEKNFARADEIRDQLAAMGIILKDTREGVTWKRA
ncbi:MAG: cysteine--tRNA ligase [Clostridiales bacterium]|nr:cysteine--tRNA ligase [Clostridiales bacterium]